ncbi:AraC-like DNA-binding protein [Paraburkholderia sp. BL8N3]|jgi:AraC-like DNA-binding protein|nr:AraC-like DNA-binding protein [Paraburkholderia sp. BL8N3]
MGVLATDPAKPDDTGCAMTAPGRRCFLRLLLAQPEVAPGDWLPSAAPTLDWVYRQACAIIQQHLCDCSLTVNFVVSAVRCSRPTVYRAFAQRHQTVAGVIRSMRLQLVCTLLASPPFNVPIETLAYRCGFEDVRTFNRSFRREFGTTAGEFRARMLGVWMKRGVPD